MPFLDLRPLYGATATMVAEHLLASGMRITAHEATALVYAIRTETRDFGREASGPDKAFYDQLLPRVRKEDLARIQHPRLPLSYFALLRQALERLAGVDNLVLSHLPEVTQPDIVPEIADLLLRLDGKTWSLCTGAHGDRIYLSLRTTKPRADAGRLMRRLVSPAGRGGGTAAWPAAGCRAPPTPSGSSSGSASGWRERCARTRSGSSRCCSARACRRRAAYTIAPPTGPAAALPGSPRPHSIPPVVLQMTDGKPLLAQLRHRDLAVRTAARERLAAAVARHGGDERGAAAELKVSVSTVRKWLRAPR